MSCGRHARWGWLTGALLPVCLLSACKHKKYDDRPLPDHVGSVLYNETKRVAKGEDVGEKLRAPDVVVDANKIRINGYVVGPRSDLSRAALKPIASVSEWAMGMRVHWKQLYPGKRCRCSPDVKLPADASFYEGANLVETLGYRGYSHHVTLGVGDRTLAFNTAVRTPPPLPGQTAKPTTRIELCHAADWQVRRTVVFKERIDPRLGPDDAVSTPWRPAPAAKLAELTRDLCASGCDTLLVGVERGAPSFHDVLATVSTVLGAERARPPRVSFRKCAITPPSAPPAPGAKPPALEVGKLDIVGALSKQAIQDVVKQDLPRFRACYEAGLKKNPALEGRVDAQLGIDAGGNVASVDNAGSDLPDKGVVKCVVRTFYTMSFPKPDKGNVTVDYPMTFAPKPAK